MAAVNPTITLEMDWGAVILDAENNAVLDAEDNAVLDGGWASVLSDSRMSVPIRIRKGNFGLGQADRVADIGTMSWGLDNSAANLGAQQGLYSPSNTNVRTNFSETTQCRFSMSSAGNTIFKFKGIRLDVIDPDSGQYGSQITHLTAVDWMDEAATTPANGLTVQLSKRDDQLITTLVATMQNSPDSTNYTTGPDQYGAAFHDVESERDTVAGVLHRIALSGLGTIFINGTATEGEELTYRSRHDLLTSATPKATLNNDMIEMRAPRLSKDRVRTVKAITHPLRIDTAATTEIFVLQQSIEIAAGATRAFTGRYIDPNTESVRIAGSEQVDPLVADTHFKFSSSDGSGNDLNSDLGVTTTQNGDATEFSFVNNHATTTGFLWFLKVLGKGVYFYDEIEHVSTDTTIVKGQTLVYDMPYQDNFGLGANVSTQMLTWESSATNERAEIHFKANRNATLMAAAIQVEPGDLISVSETVTGFSARLFLVNGIELSIGSQGRDIDVVFHCTPAQEGQLFCILNAVGFAELNTTAILAF